MTTTISEAQETLPEDLARKLEEIASERGLSPVEVVRRHFLPSDPAAPKPAPEEASGENRVWLTPQSLDELQPRVPAPLGMTAMQFIRGQWPGEETDTDEEILADLKAMDNPLPRPNPEEMMAELRAWRTPQSLSELKPRLQPPPGKTIQDILPREPWPGEETDEELLAALKAMD